MNNQRQRKPVPPFVWILLAVFFLALLIVVVFFVAALHPGEPSWADYKRQLEAKGARLDARAFIPPPVPDDQNFAMTPFFATLFDFKPGTQEPRDTNAVERVKNFAKFLPRYDHLAGWVAGDHLDLVAYSHALQASSTKNKPAVKQQPRTARELAAAALQVLAVLKPCDPVIEELRAACRRPFTRFNLAYNDPLFNVTAKTPHEFLVWNICHVLMLRASAELALNRSDRAFDDLNLMFRVLDSVKGEPLLFMQVRRTICFNEVIQVIWEGLVNQRWSEDRLRALQTRLLAFDFLADCRWALEAERACAGNAIFDDFRRKANEAKARRYGRNDSSAKPVLRLNCYDLFVRRWFELDQITYNRDFEERVFPTFDVTARHVYPQLADANARAIKQELDAAGSNIFSALWRRRFLVTGLIEATLNRPVESSAHAQTSADEAAIACALQRWRLAEGKHPETLDALAPRFIPKLPHDIITGQPLKYRRTDDGLFVLYSVGWNETDDGGSLNQDSKEGDWVWRYPAAK